MEAKIVQSIGLDFAGIKAGKFRRYHGAKLRHIITDLSTFALNIRDMGRVVAGFGDALKVLRRFRPDVVFIRGGYVSVPVGLAARLLRIPYVIHESDTVTSLTSKILASGARKIAVSWPVSRFPQWPADKLVYTGIPIRTDVLTAHRLAGLAEFKLADNLPVLLVTGGSSGARAINDATQAALPTLLEFCQVLHVAGERDIADMRAACTTMELVYPERYSLHGHLSDKWGLALAASDVVVSRAGANAMAELAILGKPAILIPGAQLTGGQQISNAQVFSRAEAVRVLPQDKLTGKVLAAEVKRLLDSPVDMQRMGVAIGQFAKPNAAHELAVLVLASGQAQNGDQAASDGQDGSR